MKYGLLFHPVMAMRRKNSLVYENLCLLKVLSQIGFAQQRIVDPVGEVGHAHGQHQFHNLLL